MHTGREWQPRMWLNDCYRWVVMEDLSWEVTYELRLEWQGVSHMKNWDKRVGRGTSKCKVLKAGISWVYSGNKECASVACAWWGRRNDNRDKLGPKHSQPPQPRKHLGFCLKCHDEALGNGMIWFRILEKSLSLLWPSILKGDRVEKRRGYCSSPGRRTRCLHREHESENMSQSM